VKTARVNMLEPDITLPLDRTRARILRVNYAGERGAIAIYKAQLLAGWAMTEETRAFLRHALAHECEHAAKFHSAMTERSVRKCPGTPIWICGGFLLGLASVLGGSRGIFACTAAIEDAVHGHLNEQIAYLKDRDAKLTQLISDIREEEIEHKEIGQAGYDPDCKVAAFFTHTIMAITNGLIWLATLGDSTRLKQGMR